MTDLDAPVPTPSAEPPPKPNSLSRIVGALTSPGETFASIARRPDWIVPLLIIVALTIIGGVLLAGQVDFQALGREAMEMNPRSAQMSSSQVEAGAHFSAAMMRISTYISPALITIALLIVSGILLVSCRAMGGEGDFRQAFAVTVYAWFPRVVKGALGLVVLMTRKSLSIFDLQNPLMSNLGFLFDPKSHPLQYALGSALDLFVIWTLVLLVIGFAAVSKLPRARTAAIVIIWWVVINGITLIGPVLQAIRR